MHDADYHFDSSRFSCLILLTDTIMSLSKRHRETYLAIFANPVRSNVVWTDIERLVVALGGEMEEGRGSRIRFVLRGVRAVFHRPHPRKETDKGALVSVRRLLLEAGVGKDEV